MSPVQPFALCLGVEVAVSILGCAHVRVPDEFSSSVRPGDADRGLTGAVPFRAVPVFAPVMPNPDDFDPEMHEADWVAVYERQAAWDGLVTRFCDLLELEAGDHVLEIGSGPGYTSARLAERVTPGLVYALDRQPDALRYLLEEADESTECIRPVVDAAEVLPVSFSQPTPTFATLILHHVSAPERAITEVAAAVPRASPFLVVEYHPDAPEGPPKDYRIAPGKMREWLSRAGFTIEEELALSERTYALLSWR